ncbi:MAG: hypothetical protein JWM50_656 [Microbacteriaceae bacterium]|nr:hypothetical protein [Microbacteriaceae bacterium]
MHSATKADGEDLPDVVDEICSQHSASFAKEDGPQQNPACAYTRPKREIFHRHARTSIESLNNGVKDHNRESIEDSSRRMVRNFAAAQVFVTILLANYNLRKIAAFLLTEAKEKSRLDRGIEPATQIKRRPDREFYSPYTKTFPSAH